MQNKFELEPPCKRFQRNDNSNINFNLVEAHQKLIEHGCSRIKSIRFLTRINCKTDITIKKTGPNKHNILQIAPNQFYVSKGWMHGERQYLNTENKNSDLINSIVTKSQIESKLIEADSKQLEELQYDLTYSARYEQHLNKKYHLPLNKQQKIAKLRLIRENMRLMIAPNLSYSPKRLNPKRANTFQLSPNHCFEFQNNNNKNQFELRRSKCSKLLKPEIDTIIKSIRNNEQAKINQNVNNKNISGVNTTQLNQLLQKIQQKINQDTTNQYMFNSPASKMGKSNSSMYATKFSLKSERSIDPL